MRLGICTIQRDRGRWLAEWVAFHYLVGFRKFYLYLHKITDDSKEVAISLQRAFDIKCFTIPDDTQKPQLVSYQHAYQEFGHEIDWMAFIDGDEFLFPSEGLVIDPVLERFKYEKLSALGVWWLCYGSNGHTDEPEGLITENYTMRASRDFVANRHIKSIVKGGQGQFCSVTLNSHMFNTIYGTRDENLSPIAQGFNAEMEPSHNHLRINHYVCQSLAYFKNFKQRSGSADAGSESVRGDDWWEHHDRNDEFDDSALKYSDELKKLLSTL
jgi:glycosyl transferase family 92